MVSTQADDEHYKHRHTDHNKASPLKKDKKEVKEKGNLNVVNIKLNRGTESTIGDFTDHDKYIDIKKAIDMKKILDKNDKDETQDTSKNSDMALGLSSLDVLPPLSKNVLNTSQTTTSEDADESAYDVVEKRDHMLENLLVLLNSAAALGVGPTPAAFAKTEMSAKSRAFNTSPMPGSGKGILRG